MVFGSTLSDTRLPHKTKTLAVRDTETLVTSEIHFLITLDSRDQIIITPETVKYQFFILNQHYLNCLSGTMKKGINYKEEKN